MEILLEIGPFRLYTLNVFLVLGLLWGGFVFFKKAGEYHFEAEQIYDLIIGSFLAGIVGVKLTSWLGLGVWGLWSFWLGVVAVGLIFAWKKKWEVFGVLDLLSLGILMGLTFWYLGEFVVRGNWWILVIAVVSLFGFVFTWRLEKVYRMFEWYKGRRSAARTGFIFGTSLLWLALMRLAMFFVFDSYLWPVLVLELLFLIILAASIIFLRSGRARAKI